MISYESVLYAAVLSLAAAGTRRPRPRRFFSGSMRGADLYVVIVAWRYGYVPEGDTPPLRRSITEIEHDEAAAAGKPVLALLLDPEAPWPLNRVDVIGSTPGAGSDISRFRTRLGSAYLAGHHAHPG